MPQIRSLWARTKCNVISGFYCICGSGSAWDAPDGEGETARWRNKKARDSTHFLYHKSTLLSTLSHTRCIPDDSHRPCPLPDRRQCPRISEADSKDPKQGQICSQTLERVTPQAWRLYPFKCSAGRMGWMSHRKWKDIKQQPGTAGPGNMLGSCLVSFHFLWAILCPQAVHFKVIREWRHDEASLFVALLVTIEV